MGKFMINKISREEPKISGKNKTKKCLREIEKLETSVEIFGILISEFRKIMCSLVFT